LEKGMKYRCRYREEWVPDDLLNRNTNISGMEGIIVFFDNKTKELFPIMRITIDQKEILGDVLYIEFTIGSLVKYNNRQDKSNEYDLPLKNVIKGKYLDTQKGQLIKYVFLLNDGLTELAFDDDLSSWVRILNRITVLDPFRNSIFLKIIRVTDSRGNVIMPKEVNRGTREVGYELKSHKMYKVEVFQRTRDDFPRFVSFRLNLFFISDHIVPIKESEVIMGKYDKLQLALFTKWTKGDLQTVIGLKSTPTEIDVPEVYVPLKILRDTGKLVGSIATISSGVGVSIFAGYVPQLLSIPGTTITTPLLSIVGAALVALGVSWLRPMYE
jgi:hypothetical protein